MVLVSRTFSNGIAFRFIFAN